jgi:hypothetical protein
MFLNFGCSMTLVRHQHPNVPGDHADFKVELGARMKYRIRCELRHGELNGLANGMRLIAEESRSEVPSFSNASRRSAEVLLQRPRRHL